MNKNELKNRALGMPYGTATSKLRKILLFALAEKLQLLNCYRCGNLIETLEEFSIEHKQSWLYSQNPKEAFFDLDNIGFSHLICNVRAGDRSGPRIRESNRMKNSNVSWCSVCKHPKPIKEFGKNRYKSNGLATECLLCRKTR